MVAVIIPTYNRAQLLTEALDSLVLQTKKDFITVVVDDASTEDIKAVTDLYSKKLHLVYLKQEQNGGPGLARQAGLDWAAERNITFAIFLDSDDMLYPDAVYRLTYEIQHTNANIVSAQISAENTTSGFLIEAENMTWTHGKIYRISYLSSRSIRFLPNPRTNEDLCFNLRALNGEKRRLLQQPLYLWRKAAGSITRTPESVKDIRGIDYISAIYHTVKYSENDPEKMRLLMADIICCYNYYQMATKYAIPDYLNDQLSYMLNLPEVKTTIETPKKLEKFVKCINQCDTEGDEIFWFQESFYDWYHRFLKKED